MIRSTFKKAALLAFMAGLLIRVMTPLGYMPAAPGSGLLFELCPDRLPPGILLPQEAASAHHHHANSGDRAGADGDQCQLGHLLFSALTADSPQADVAAEYSPGTALPLPATLISHPLVSGYQSRGPPRI